MESLPLLDCCGRRRSPATTPSFHQRLRLRNKGLRYRPDPPTVEEIVAVMQAAGEGPEGLRLRGSSTIPFDSSLSMRAGPVPAIPPGARLAAVIDGPDPEDPRLAVMDHDRHLSALLARVEGRDAPSFHDRRTQSSMPL